MLSVKDKMTLDLQRTNFRYAGSLNKWIREQGRPARPSIEGEALSLTHEPSTQFRYAGSLDTWIREQGRRAPSPRSRVKALSFTHEPSIQCGRPERDREQVLGTYRGEKTLRAPRQPRTAKPRRRPRRPRYSPEERRGGPHGRCPERAAYAASLGSVKKARMRGPR